jgi:hypothetical protein
MFYISKALSFGAIFAMFLVNNVARADDKTDDTYCEKIQARAHADSMLLFSPAAQLQFIKYPAGAPGVVAVGGSTSVDGLQFRGAISWSPLDAYKGTQVLTLADKDCLQHSATVEVQNLLEQMNDIGRQEALGAEVSYFDAVNSVMEDISSGMQKRLAIGTITITDIATVQQSIAALERKKALSQGQLDVIRSKDYVVTTHSAADIAAKLQRYSMEFEQQTSKVRMLDPWTVAVSGGVIPPMAQGDGVAWFGMVQLQYNFGGLVRGTYENKYLNARQSELQHARYELTDEIRRLQDGIKAGVTSSELEIVTLDKRLADLHAIRDTLSNHLDAPNAISALAVVNLQILDAESDRVYLVVLKNQLSQWK